MFPYPNTNPFFSTLALWSRKVSKISWDDFAFGTPVYGMPYSCEDSANLQASSIILRFFFNKEGYINEWDTHYDWACESSA